jgi:ribosomal protein S18 acetylase RimI-like enzyme
MRRLAIEHDLENVFAIYMHGEVIPFLGFDPLSRENFRFIYDDLLQSNCFFVYELAGHVAGFYKASRHTGRAQHVAYLSNVAVHPSMHGRGVGRAMVGDAIAKLHIAGVRRIELLVESDNTHAIAFYKRLGFEHEGTMRMAYKRATQAHYVDEVAMALLLD